MTHDYTCLGKIRFFSRRKVKRWAAQDRRNGGDHLTTYCCTNCGMWHNGHRPRTTTRRRNTED